LGILQIQCWQNLFKMAINRKNPTFNAAKTNKMNKPDVSESYKCYNCGKDLPHTEVTADWKCVTCSEPVAIKMEIDGDDKSVSKVTPDELDLGSLMFVRGAGNFIVLNVKETDKGYNIALQGYRVITVPENRVLIVINGIWA